jgi:uncharacterized membrane protein
METKIKPIEQSIECNAPVETCYNQWTQFESFPSFMEGVKSVTQVDDTHLHWVAEIAGVRKEWDAEIIEQDSDRFIAWRSTSGALNNGAVLFEPIGLDRCKITLTMTYAPEDAKEKVGSALGVLSARVRGDLRNFKRFIEKRQLETGAWRGKVRGGNVEGDARTVRPTGGYGALEGERYGR